MSKNDTALLIEGRVAAMSGRGKDVREAVGLTQSDIARMVGVTPAAVSRWEAGGRLPTAKCAISYGRALRQLEQLAGTGAQSREVVA